MEFFRLDNGVRMPAIGYGVFQVSNEECRKCVSEAIACGYRLIDTAQSYGNEEQVGEAVADSGIPRNEFFITTKVWIDQYGYEKTKASVLASMDRLKTDYIDLVLLHQPFGDYYGAYRALEDLYTEGRLRAIGVSNFYPDRLVDIASFSRIRPMVNQIEVHPYHQQETAKKWMNKYNVQTEAWAPFGEGKSGIFTDPVLSAIAEKHGKTVAQIILRWNVQRGVIAIPKSVHMERMKENIDIFDFELDQEDSERIEKLDRSQSVFFSHSSPETVEMFAQRIKSTSTQD